jgi:hypothetical protein
MASGGFCQNPGCRRELWLCFVDGTATTLEEFAHVIPQSDDGPRGEEADPGMDRDTFENIVMLCPTCHTVIDKAKSQFPRALLLRWKEEHSDTIRSAMVPVHSSRSDLRMVIEPMLAENRAMFYSYGPWSLSANQPWSDSAKTWSKMVIDHVLPNNRRINALLKSHRHLLTESERETATDFSVHVEAFEYNHLSGDKRADAPLFPEDMNMILMEP